MSDLSFVFFSLKSRWLNSILSVLLTAFGLSIALLITQFGNHIQNRLNLDGQGIDIVVGAKGSPLQLILSSVYHIDIPNGNIPYHASKKLINDPRIKKSIPLALGDNWKGYRIVGTTSDYLKHYNAEINEGRIWNKEFEVVAGSNVNIKINNEFSGSHGLSNEGYIHDSIKYKVIGKLKPTGSVLDRLILTSINSVLNIHGQENIEDHKHENHEKRNNNDDHNHEHHDEKDNSDDHSKIEEPEITAFLITTKSPIANINLPRKINRESSLQAANPALEMTRLTSMLGLGSKSFNVLSTILISIAVLSIFSGLASNLENRVGDLAILRAIGYYRSRIFKIIILEGATIVTVGIVFGNIIGFLGFKILTKIITPLNISDARISFTSDYFFIIAIILFSGLIAAIFPAYHASKISVANQLSKNI